MCNNAEGYALFMLTHALNNVISVRNVNITAVHFSFEWKQNAG